MCGESNRQLVYDHLRDAMARGDYPPGTRLINRTMANELGTSFAPVREAICQLFSDGLVEMQPGIGAYVKVPDRREIEELLVLREELEGRAAQEAARHITARQLDRLQSICDRWKEILRNRISADGGLDLTEGDIVEIVELDQQFHGIIIRAANNRVLTKTLMNVRLLARIFRAMKDGEVEFQKFSPISWAWIWREHASLVRALRRGDSADARRWPIQTSRTKLWQNGSTIFVLVSAPTRDVSTGLSLAVRHAVFTIQSSAANVSGARCPKRKWSEKLWSLAAG